MVKEFFFNRSFLVILFIVPFLSFLFVISSSYGLVEINPELKLNFSTSDLYRANLNMNLNYESINIIDGNYNAITEFNIYLKYFVKETSSLGVERKIAMKPSDSSGHTINDNFILFNWKIGSKSYSFSIDEEIINRRILKKIKDKVSYPIKEEYRDMYKGYLKANELIDSDNKDIINFSNNFLTHLKENDDLFIIVFNLAKYVHDNIEYVNEPEYSQETLKASEVLNKKQGVCDEFTALFVALCRALNIPARVVNGLAYTNSPMFDQPIGHHAWAEVYFPNYGWVAFDPTYGEYGDLDITHLGFMYANDTGKASLEYKWQASETLDIIRNELILRVDNFSISGEIIKPSLDYKLISLHNNVDIGSYNAIILRVENLEDYYVVDSFSLSQTEELKVIECSEDSKDNYNVDIVLKPGESKTIYWIVKVDDKLSKKYYYNFRTIVKDNYGYTKNTSFEVKKDNSFYSLNDIKKSVEHYKDNKTDKEEYDFLKDIVFNCSSNKETALLDESVDFFCNLNIKNNSSDILNRYKLEVCFSEDCTVIRNKNSSLSYSKRFDDTGTYLNSFVLRVDNNIIMKRDVFIDIVTKDKVIISKIIVPREINYHDYKDRWIDVIVEIEKKSEDISNLKLTLSTGSKESSFDLDSLDEKERLNISVSSIYFMNNNKKYVKIDYRDDISGEIKTQKKEFSITFNKKNMNLIDKIMLFFKKIFS